MTESHPAPRRSRAYRWGVAVWAATSLLTVWTTIVRDDGSGSGYFMLILATMVGAVAAWFRPAGMARAMAGVAVMQALLGALTATAPVTAAVPGAPIRVLVFTGVFVALWLFSAVLFRVASHAAPTAP